MATTMQQWADSKKGLDAARQKLEILHATVNKKNGELYHLTLVKAGQRPAAVIIHSAGVQPLSTWPTEEEITLADQEFRNALRAEDTAWNGLSPADQKNASRN